MNSEEKVAIQDSVARLLQEDFRDDFQPIFEWALQVLGVLVSNANDEIRLVQNHCAAALSSDDLSTAEIHISRARRHIQQAKYFCLIQMVIRQLNTVTAGIENAERHEARATALREHLEGIKNARKSIPSIGVERRSSLSQILIDIGEAVAVNVQLEIILTRTNELAEQLYDMSLLQRAAPSLSPNERETGRSPVLDRNLRSQGRTTPVSKPRSKIGRALLANKHEIALSATALLILINEKIASLRAQRPNSNEAKSQLEEEIAQYEGLREQLDALTNAAASFAAGEVKEGTAVKSATGFADGVQSWWTKSHPKICERAFDMALFVSAVGVCSLAGAGGLVSVIVSGALVGGKPVIDAIKSVGKSLSKGPMSRD